MSAKKRASDAAEPPSKVATPDAECAYASKGSSCRGVCRIMEEACTKKQVMLCERHRRCGQCHEELESGKLGLGCLFVACVLPPGTPKRLQNTCAFWCGSCKRFMLKRELAECCWKEAADDTAELGCRACWRKCHLCRMKSRCRNVLFGSRFQTVCIECVPHREEFHEFSVSEPDGF